MASPANRGQGKKLCENCCGTLLIEGSNDLRIWCHENNRLDILRDWNTNLNIEELGVLNTPDKMRFNLYKRVYWKCHLCGYEWQSRIAERTIIGKGCEKCSYKERSKRHHKRVRNIDTGTIYESIKDAELAVHGKIGTNICQCCKGKYETAYGFHWEYI